MPAFTAVLLGCGRNWTSPSERRVRSRAVARRHGADRTLRRVAASRLLPWLLFCLAVSPAGEALAAAAPHPEPYLAATKEPDEIALLPPPPAPDTALASTERAVYAATRGLQGTPRWALATDDADRDPARVLKDFDCAFGFGFDAAKLPRLVQLLARLDADVEQATAPVKALYHRRRPLVGNEAPLCVPRTEKLAESFSYPSGHATQGWASALVLAELAPDRAGAILARGRVYGESRIVCGVHWPSDVEAARTAGASLVAVLHDVPEFRADLAAAREDLEALRASRAAAPEPALCRIEADAAAHTPASTPP
jgi:acid phosphatase (class A)